MLVAVLIPIYNRLEITKKGITNLKQSIDEYYKKIETPIVKYELIVVDDASTDGSSEWIGKNYPTVHLLHGSGNLWWTGAINMAAKYAVERLKSDYVLLWNDDIITNGFYFEAMSSKILSNKNMNQIFGSYIYEFPLKDKLWTKGGYFNKYLGIRSMYRNEKKSVKKNYWFTGMGTLIPSNILIKLNFFDFENFPHYHGDTDFTLRAFESGIELVAYPDLKIWNKVEYSFVSASTWSGYFKSLKSIKSRYNIKTETAFLRSHSVTPLWILYLSKRQAENLIYFLRNKYFK